jgi:MFS family permease
MGRTLDRARHALRSTDFRFLLGARLVSQLADGIFQAYLIDRVVFLSAESGTAAAVAKAFALLVIPFSLVGPATGVVIDRWSRRRILAVTPLVRAVAVLGLLLAASEKADWPLYVLALVVVSLNRFYLATAGAVMPSLVRDEDLLVGNSLSAAAGTVLTFAGLVAGTQLADAIGSRSLLTIILVCWPISTILAVRIRDRLQASRPEGRLRAELRRVAGELVRGARRLAATPSALGSITSVSFDQFLIGLITVLSVVVFKNEFRQGVASYGRIVGAGGVGVLVGSLTVGWFEGRLAKPQIMSLAFALAGAACLAGSIHIAGPSIIVISFTLGLTYPWRKVPADTIVQESTPDRYRGRVFALYDLMFSLPRVISAALAILLIPQLSSGAYVAIVGAAYLLWAPIPPRWIRRPRWVDLRFYAGARADEVPRAVVIGGDEEPVEVLGSWREQLEDGPATTRRWRFRLRASDGSVVEVARADGQSRWLLREVPADPEESDGQRNAASRDSGQ